MMSRTSRFADAPASFHAVLRLLVGVAVLAGLLALGHTQLARPQVAAFDHAAMLRVHACATPLLTAIALALTQMGSILIFLSAVSLVVCWLLWRGQRHTPVVLGLAMTGALILNETLKLYFHRIRPHLPWSIGDEHTFSYPSGHSFFSVVLYGTLAYLALRDVDAAGRRVTPVLIAIVMPLCIGWSRIYLGMHFPTDVAAGFCAGLVWVATVAAVDRALARHC
jgi:membrane-associated phospholipid phosphatase